MTLSLWQVDAFTAEPYRGNPAAVCLLDRERPDVWMQALAAEMNLSETAFLLPTATAEEYRLRWFTPASEVDLCGHATLASAHYLWESGRLDPERSAGFLTRSGRLGAHQREGWIDLDFPATPATEVTAPPPELARALGVEPSWAGRNQSDYLIVTEDPGAVVGCTPDFEILRSIGVRGIILTALAPASSERGPSEPKADFISRFFAPGVGIDEDPVTGSAHCTLAPYWAGRLGRQALTGFQASRRGGVVRVEVRGERVRLSGRAVTVLRGTLTAEAL